MVCYAAPVIVYHGVLFFTTIGSEKHTMIHNHWLRIKHHESKPLAQHNTSLFTTTGLIIAHHDSQPLAQHNTP
jgi:hypothetical protein